MRALQKKIYFHEANCLKVFSNFSQQVCIKPRIIFKLCSRGAGDANEAIKVGAETKQRRPISRPAPTFRQCLQRKRCHYTAELPQKRALKGCDLQ